MKSNFLSNIKIQDINPMKDAQTHINQQVKNLEQLHEQMADLREKEKEEKTKYDQDVLETLKSIEKNTGDINQIISILHYSNGKQDEILEVMKEILAIGKATNEEEADTLYRNAMDKAQKFNGDVETITVFLGYAKIAWTAVKGYLSIGD